MVYPPPMLCMFISLNYLFAIYLMGDTGDNLDYLGDMRRLVRKFTRFPAWLISKLSQSATHEELRCRSCLAHPFSSCCAPRPNAPGSESPVQDGKERPQIESSLLGAV
ncbi:hypothetical protein F5Y06DRAFT_278231 [Hypoxylon sp. FL0890]|nr:hypothetical protein F5Y06DRAFT_278231 [Hypoxylon sp. FL0890]